MSKQIVGNKYWQPLAQKWRNYQPPFRLSADDIKIYEKFLKRAIIGKRQPKILVLGSTPDSRQV